ncbi:MAG: ABC transporter permease [Nitrososphaerota archaeon]|nr:ABC transporter permease [Nitrososphaerota archaeon]
MAQVTPGRESAWRMFFRRRAAKTGLVIIGAILLLVVIGPFVVPYGPYQSNFSLVNSPPSLAHPLGTEYQGRDILSQLVWGAQSSLLVGVGGAVGAVIIGTVIGMFAGYFRRLEGLLTGFTDIIMIFPAVPLIVLLGTLRPVNTSYLIIILSVVLWPPVARSIRSQVLSVKQLPYVEVAKMSGMRDLEIVYKVIFPAVAAIIFAYFVLTVAACVVLVTGLEFLGVGNPDVVSWGSMIYWAQQFGFYSGSWWWIVAPGAVITLFTVGLAMIGYSVEEVMNPRLRV